MSSIDTRKMADDTAKFKEFEEKGVEISKAKDIIVHFLEENKDTVFTFKGLVNHIGHIIPDSTIFYALQKLLRDSIIQKKLLHGKLFYGLTNGESKNNSHTPDNG